MDLLTFVLLRSSQKLFSMCLSVKSRGDVVRKLPRDGPADRNGERATASPNSIAEAEMESPAERQERAKEVCRGPPILFRNPERKSRCRKDAHDPQL